MVLQKSAWSVVVFVQQKSFVLLISCDDEDNRKNKQTVCFCFFYCHNKQFWSWRCAKFLVLCRQVLSFAKSPGFSSGPERSIGELRYSLGRPCARHLWVSACWDACESCCTAFHSTEFWYGESFRFTPRRAKLCARVSAQLKCCFFYLITLSSGLVWTNERTHTIHSEWKGQYPYVIQHTRLA